MLACDQVEGKLRRVSRFVFVSRSKKTWIPACAGMTGIRVDFQPTISEPLGVEPRFGHFTFAATSASRSI